MNIKTITYIQRKNFGNFEFAELTATAELKENENEVVAVEKLMSYVQSSLNKEVKAIEEAPAVVEEAPVKEKKTRVKKEKVEETVEEVKEAPKKGLITYDSSIVEHKSILGGYLLKKYDNSWKTSHPAEQIKAFTSSLNGKEFIDSEGHIAESFLNLVHEFFGA